MARAGGRDFEMVKVPAPPEAANGAGVLLLPGEASEAAAMLVPAARLARQGVSVVIVNSPGRGRTKGPDDCAGPASRAAALAALDTLAHMPGVLASRLGAWGVSRGGTVALEISLDRPGALRAVAASSACYDLWAAYRAASPAGKAAILASAGTDSSAWRARSPLLRAADFKPVVLVHHGEKDAVYSPAAAHAFVEAVKAGGGAAVGRFAPSGTHELPNNEPIRFLQSRLAPPPQ
jgi:dipeptidyl aminopeptidase/acylaminoacyl peptidase